MKHQSKRHRALKKKVSKEVEVKVLCPQGLDFKREHYVFGATLKVTAAELAILQKHNFVEV